MKARTPVTTVALASLPFLLLLFLLASFLATNPLYNRHVSRTAFLKDGEADLTYNPSGINELHGEWLFWWGRFVSGPGETPPDGFGPLPGSWKDAGRPERYGYASWAIRVRGLNPSRTYVFRAGQTLSACRILANGSEIASIGRPGRSKGEEVPYWGSVYARFAPRSDGTADIVLQVSNYRDWCGGSNASLYIGEAALMNRMADRLKLTETFVFSILCALGLFFLALYAFRRKEIGYLWFAALSLVFGFRALCYDNFVLLDLFPSMPWHVYFRLGYLTFPTIVVCFYGFVRNSLGELVSRGLFRLIGAVFGSYALLIVFVPVSLVCTLLMPLEFVTLCIFPYILFVIVRAGLRRVSGAFWLLFGLCAALGTFLYDMLVSMWILSGFSVAHIGMGVCLFCLALMVLERYSAAYRMARGLSEQLQGINRSLHRFVPAEFLACLNKESIVDVQPGDCVEQDMAILSADIRSFTAIAEKMTPDGVFRFLNEYLELVGPIIRSHEGFIAKYEGDGFMALFPKGAESAVRCAVQMQSAISARNRDAEGVTKINVGIGIDAGRLALGTIGDDSRLDGAVISSCVKGATRLESLTKVYQSRILINGPVFAELSDPLSWFVRPVDRVDTGTGAQFLFEIYNNDSNSVRDMKWKTQGELEHALYSWFSGNFEDCRRYITRVLENFPTDPVAHLYAERLNDQPT